jgi:hypothetical protein
MVVDLARAGTRVLGSQLQVKGSRSGSSVTDPGPSLPLLLLSDVLWGPRFGQVWDIDRVRGDYLQDGQEFVRAEADSGRCVEDLRVLCCDCLYWSGLGSVQNSKRFYDLDSFFLLFFSSVLSFFYSSLFLSPPV